MRALPLLALLAAAAAPDPDPIETALARARPRPAEERWRAVPWRTSLAAALEEARTANRPVFFFAYDGVLGSGNC